MATNNARTLAAQVIAAGVALGVVLGLIVGGIREVWLLWATSAKKKTSDDAAR